MVQVEDNTHVSDRWGWGVGGWTYREGQSTEAPFLQKILGLDKNDQNHHCDHDHAVECFIIFQALRSLI